MAEISIIIPTYNRAHTLGRAIASVLNQTHGNFEIVVIDDGSTDQTKRLMKEFKDRVGYIRHDHNLGVSAARNTGVKNGLKHEREGLPQYR